MKYLTLLFVLVLISCSSETETKSIQSNSLDSLSIDGIFELYSNSNLAQVKKWNNKESIVPNKYIEGKFDTISESDYRESKIILLNGIITNGLILNNEVNPFGNIRIGDRKAVIESKISDLKEKLNPNLTDGPTARYQGENLIISSSIEQTETILFNYENGILKSIETYNYYE